jgi:hypothetical protein
MSARNDPISFCEERVDFLAADLAGHRSCHCKPNDDKTTLELLVLKTNLSQRRNYMAVRIIKIHKPGGAQNPHEAISKYAWVNEDTNREGVSDRPTMVDWIGNKKGYAYVTDAAGTVRCYVNKSPAGTQFLQTYADGRWTDNLLSLEEF